MVVVYPERGIVPVTRSLCNIVLVSAASEFIFSAASCNSNPFSFTLPLSTVFALVSYGTARLNFIKRETNNPGDRLSKEQFSLIESESNISNDRSYIPPCYFPSVARVF